MTEGIKPSYEQGKGGSVSLLISLVMGFSLFWSSFYTALVCTTPPSMTQLLSRRSPRWRPLPCAPVWWSWPLRAIDGRTSSRCRKGIVSCGLWSARAPLLTGPVSYAQFVIDLHVPVLVVFVASFLLGIGLSALLLLWSELLTAFTENFTSKVLSFSMAGGSLLYFVGNCLPDGAGIAFSCLASPAEPGASAQRLEKRDARMRRFVPRAGVPSDGIV